MSRLAVCLLLLLSPAFALAADDDDPEPPGKGGQVQGDWTFSRAIAGDPKNGPTPPNDLTLKFDKGKLTVTVMNQPAKSLSYKIDPRQKPAHLDLDDGNGKQVPGIYKIEKGELYVCIGERSNTRPTAFDGKTDPVIVLKKMKK